MKTSRVAELKARVRSGDISIAEPVERFFSRLDRYLGATSDDPLCLSDLELLKPLIERAGLRIVSIDNQPHSCPSRQRRYLMIVLEKA